MNTKTHHEDTFVERNNVKLFRLLLVFVLALFPLARCEYDDWYNQPNLPIHVTPLAYELRLLTHLENPSEFRYEGAVSISVHVHHDTSELVLHVANLKIEEENIELLSTSIPIRLVSVRYNKRLDYMILNFKSPLETGQIYNLNIFFQRMMSENSNSGYFVRHYMNAGRKSWYSVTHFERHRIRGMMPCFDEPAIRTTFKVRLGHHKRFHSFSNTKVIAVFPNPNITDYVWSEHEVTPMMPTYLLAFSVNNFTCRFSQTASPYPVAFRTCSPAGQMRDTSFLDQMGPLLLTRLANKLQVRLPLEKVDQLVVDGYPTVASQSLGLVIYDSQTILLPEQVDGPMTRHQLRALEVITHEVAHMWFGTLLGLESWSDAWLHEGLVGWLQGMIIDQMEPSNGRRLMLRQREASLMHEGLVGGVTIDNKIELVPTIKEKHLFEKATALMDMLTSILGSNTFYDGLQRHLLQHSFASSGRCRFLRVMQLACERNFCHSRDYNLRTIMDTWILQKGYPLVTVTRTEGGLKLTQSPALNESWPQRWWIPLTYTTQSSDEFQVTQPKLWLRPEQNTTFLNLSLLPDEWVIFNVQGTGYYRVQYDAKTLRALGETLNDDFRSIHVMNRAQIVSDILFLCRQNRITWSDAFNVLKYIVDEDEYEPLTAFVVGVTNGFWRIRPEISIAIAKWLGIAGKWYAEFINYTFEKFVIKQKNSLDTLDVSHFPERRRSRKVMFSGPPP